MTNNQESVFPPSPDHPEVIMKTGEERFHVGPDELSEDLLSFWQWAISDLLHRTTRGVFAEYIVSLALEIPLTIARIEYDAYDLKTSSGIKIEVKSASWLKSSTTSLPDFKGIGIVGGKSKKRNSDIFIFCFLNCSDREKVDPLNMDQWDFYAVPTNELNRELPDKNNITLKRLKKLFNPEKHSFKQLKNAVEIISRDIK